MNLITMAPPHVAPWWMLQAILIVAAMGLASCVLPPRQPNAEKRDVLIYQGKATPSGTQKWNPAWWLGNADDPVPPAWYRPQDKCRSTLWQLRNPLHNFTFYVIGVADKDFVRYGREPSAVFKQGGGWNWAVIHQGWVRLPFVSYQGRHLQFYALWRERGNFGLKLRRNKNDDQRPVAETSAPRIRAYQPSNFPHRR